MAAAEKLREGVTYKGLLSIAGAIVALLVGMGTIHAQFVVPGIVQSSIEKSREVIDEAIDDHTQHPHPGAVSRLEFNMLREDIKEIKEILRNR